MVRNPRIAGQPAVPGDHVTIYATGLQRASNVSARFGNLTVAPDSITQVPNAPGLFQVMITVPALNNEGSGTSQVALSLTADYFGTSVSTNAVSIAVE
jgi:hypothetical protein